MFFERTEKGQCIRLPSKTVLEEQTDANLSLKQNTNLHFSGTFRITEDTGIILLVTVGLLALFYYWFTRYKLVGTARVAVFTFLFIVSYGTICLFLSSVILLCVFLILERCSCPVPWTVKKHHYVTMFVTFLGWVISYAEISIVESMWLHATIISGVTCCTMLVIRYHWGLPLEIIKNNLSFDHQKPDTSRGGCPVKEQSGKGMRSRSPGQLNPIYVNGWIPLVECKDVPRDKPLKVFAIGYEFCVFRGETEHIFVLDAYCPHLGADVTAGGRVVGNCVECPFHGMHFSGETGKCTKIPYSDRAIPEAMKTKKWVSCEKNGFVFVWHHAENVPPTWELPSIPEIENKKWVYRGKSEFTVYCHIQEIPENGADFAHLAQVHSKFVFWGSRLEDTGKEGRLFQHKWKPRWTKDTTNSHIAYVNLEQELYIKGYRVPWTQIKVDIEQIGPATVHLYINCDFGRGVMLQYITTESSMQQRVVQLMYTEPSFKQAPANFLIWGEAIMVERDVEVWNNKKFLKNPLLLKEDTYILRFRRWYSQFYSEHSPTLRNSRPPSLKW